jgi:rhodanese-related sulfurtransferase
MSDWLKGLFWWVPFGKVPELPPAALHTALVSAEPPLLLDVRTKSEWQHERIEGAVNVPVTELKGRLPTLEFGRERPVVAICRSAHRSIGAVRLLELHGFTAARQLQGGMLAWQQAGLPVVVGEPA